VSREGNLYASTLVRLRPTDPPAPTLALVAAVALEDAVSVFLGTATGLRIKWPNDLLLGGAKVAGILLEREGDVIVAGFGVNCAHHPELPDRPTISLADAGVDLPPAILVEALAESFALWLSRWRGEGIAPVRARWTERAHPRGTALVARTGDEAVEGLFDGLDADGALLLRLPNGTRRTIHAGDVFLL
jgi:BirA family biotin operon repressor/biotin-[acetyl-CoA-carboxylase] ligase